MVGKDLQGSVKNLFLEPGAVPVTEMRRQNDKER